MLRSALAHSGADAILSDLVRQGAPVTRLWRQAVHTRTQPH